MFHFSTDGTPSTSGYSCERFICRECASYSNSAEAGTALPSVGSDDFRLQLCMNLVVSLPDPDGSEYGGKGGCGCNVVNRFWGFMFSGLWCYVAGWVLPNILKNHSAFIFTFKGLHDPNDKDIVILRNIGNCWSIDTASLAGSLESSAGALWELQILHCYKVFWTAEYSTRES